MGLSGTITNNFRTGYSLRIDWSAIQDIANNTSTITSHVYLVSLGSGYTISSSAGKTLKVTIDGTTYTYTVTVGLSGNQTKLLATSTKTITHNSDGSKTFAISGELAVNISFSSGYTGTVYLSSQTFTLDTIARSTTPTLSAGSTQMGNAVTINTPRASGSFVHTLKYSFGSASGTIATGVGTSHAWTIPLSLADQVPNSVSGTGTITCETYNGSTLIGSKAISFTATVPSTVVPTVSLAKAGVDLHSTKYVQGKSKVTVTLTDGGSYSSTISARSTTVKSGANLITSSSGSSFTSGVINYSGTITITTTVTDSRGRTATASTTIIVVIYEVPKVTAFSAFRSNADGSPNPQGAFMRITGSSLIASIESTNTKSTTLRYRIKGATTWTSPTVDSTLYNPSLAVTVSADVNSSFEVQIYVVDAYTNTTTTISVGTGFVLMDFHSSGNSMAIGKVAEGNGVLEIGGTLNITDGLKIGGVNIMLLIYPIGAIFISTVATSPATLFGGTWVQLQNQFLLGAGTSYTAGATGGASTHTLTEPEMPRHNHYVGNYNANGGADAVTPYFPTSGGATGYTSNIRSQFSGGGVAHNNMPPYLVVYMWKRTA